jgi:hypothetical protein
MIRNTRLKILECWKIVSLIAFHTTNKYSLMPQKETTEKIVIQNRYHCSKEVECV